MLFSSLSKLTEEKKEAAKQHASQSTIQTTQLSMAAGWFQAGCSRLKAGCSRLQPGCSQLQAGGRLAPGWLATDSNLAAAGSKLTHPHLFFIFKQAYVRKKKKQQNSTAVVSFKTNWIT